MTDEMHELAGLYVVDALTPDETRDYEVHLAACPTCPAEVAELREVAVWLSRSEAADPPATLRTSVLDAIGSAPQEAAPPAATPRHRSLESGEVVAMPERRRSRLPYLVAAAAVLVAFAFGGWALQSRNDANEASQQRAQIVSLLGQDDVRIGTAPGANGGTGAVVSSKNAGEALFVTNNLPALDKGQVYELWTVVTAPVPAGTFTPTSDVQVVPLPDAALSADAVAVSVEPEGGSPHPTTTPLMLVQLPKA